MKKPLKIAAILAGVVVGLIVLAIVLIAVFVDPNRYRDDIVRAVKTHTGRDLQIDGKLRLSFFPRLGLATDALTLSNAPGFGKEPFARVEAAGVQVELMPLLRKEIVVEAVHLKGLNLNLARNDQGKTNWQDMVPAQAPAKQEPAPTKQPGAAGAAALAVNKLEVSNANITWDDRQSSAHYAVRGLNLTSGNVLGNTPVPVKLSFDFESGQPKIKNRVELNARANIDLASDTLNVPELKLNAGPLALQASLVGSEVQKNPKFAGRIDVARFNARDLMRQFGVGYAPADPKAMTAVGLNTRYTATTNSLALSDFALTLDDSRLTGSASAASFTPLVPRFDLAIDRLDLDRYLPAAEKGGGNAAGKDKPAAAAVVIPLALLRELDTQGRLKIQTLKAFNLQSQDVSVQVSARNGNITLGPNTAKLYGGSYSGRTVIDASAKVPKFQFAEKLANVQLGPFLKDAEVFDRYSGTGNVDLNLTSQGLDGPAITKNLNGTAAIALRDGKVRGVNLQKLVNDARAAYDVVRGREVQGSPQANDETAFQSLTANIKVTNGVARNEDLQLVGPVVRATGQGSADLAQETIDYRLRVTVSEAADRKGTTFPVHISGPFASPKYSVDVGEILKEKAGEALERKGESLQKKLEDKLKRKLQR